MVLNEIGKIADEEWMKLPERFPNLELDAFQVMPNHIHGILVIKPVGAGPAPAPNNTGIDDASNNSGIDDTPNNTGFENNNDDNRAGASPAPTITITIGNIIGAYKSLVANRCLRLFNAKQESGDVHRNEMMGKLWQRNYYEHIIRNERSYSAIAKYIVSNPQNWIKDKFFIE